MSWQLDRMNSQLLLDIIEETRKAHPPECVFDRTNEKIAARAVALAFHNFSKESIINACATAIREAEIYCPHHGIDRR